MKLRLIAVPYDSGHREWRMGKGPAHLLRHGLASSIRALGHEVTAEFVELEDHTPVEVASSFALYRSVALRVRDAYAHGVLPVILGGNCGVTLGAVAGVGDDPAVLWLDAHGDFNTPDTSESGFLDGMSLAALTGRCWQRIASTIPTFAPLPEEFVVLAGTRALDAQEAELLAASEIRCAHATDLQAHGVGGSIVPLLDQVRGRVSRGHLHLDLDVLDPTMVGRANPFACEGGLSRPQLEETIRAFATRFTVTSMTISAFDPDYDLHGGVFHAVVGALETLVQSIGTPRMHEAPGVRAPRASR
jgi:arginase